MLKNIVLNLERRTVFNHHENLPNSFRMLIVGSSGSGKTSLLFRMLIEPDFIDYNNLIIFTTTPKQQEYQLLYHGFMNGLSKASLAALILNQNDFQNIPIPVLTKQYSKTIPHKTDTITITLSSNTNDITHPDTLDKNHKHLIVFDDGVNTSNQTIMAQYFSRGRHSNCNCIYLSQSYFDLNKSIRLNSNYLILFKLSHRNKVDVYNNIVNSIMDRNKFNTFADNIWSKKYGYIAINRDDNMIYDDIFAEQKINENNYLSNEYMSQSTDENIKQMSNVIEQRELLKNKFQTHDLALKGMYEQAARVQEPTIKAIKDAATPDTNTNKTVINASQPRVSHYTNLRKTSIDAAYGLIPTTDAIYVSNLNESFDLWKFNSSSKGNVGRFILFTHGNDEFIWDKSFNQMPAQLSPGLNEILFNNGAQHDLINPDDVYRWEQLVTQAGLGSSYKSSKLYKDIHSRGAGLDIVPVPSSRDELIKELHLQLQATEAGHNDTFDYANALMKQMLKQGILKSADYREILRDYYHI